jgi:hypothetical protein
MPLSPTINVGILCSAPGRQVFSSSVTLGDAAPAPPPPPNHFCCTVVTDDEAGELESDKEDDATLSSATSIEGEDDDVSDSNPTSTMPNAPGDDVCPVVIPFDLDHDDPSTNVVSQDDATSALDNQSELLRWHYRLGRLPFTNLRFMAARGEITKRLASCKIPQCQSCLYSKATKKPWRTKGQVNSIRTVTIPGECISVDQLESAVVGFVGQNKGYFFTKRYKVATIFVDHFS